MAVPPGIGVDDLGVVEWMMEANGRNVREGGKDERRVSSDLVALDGVLKAAGERGDGEMVVARGMIAVATIQADT